MIINSNSLSENSEISGDIVIVGAGAAGIAAALELEMTKKKIIVLESGFREPVSAVSRLNEGNPSQFLHDVNHSNFLTDSRTRQLGGSTNCWGGTCRPLDAVDFEYRSKVPYSGWPITRNALVDCYKRAQSICSLDDYRRYEPSTLNNSEELMPQSERLRTVIFQESHPKYHRFQVVYSDRLRNSTNILVYTNSTVVALDDAFNKKHLKSLKVSNINGTTFFVRCKSIILAVGGIEVVRLLMNSEAPNRNDLLGRFFMIHPLIQRAADTEIEKGRYPLYTSGFIGKNNAIITARLAPPEEAIRGSSLGNFRLQLLYYHATDSVVVNLNWEQLPSPNNRVLLSEDVDSFGSRRVALEWNLSKKDKETAIWAIESLRDYLGEQGLGNLANIASSIEHVESPWEPYEGAFSPGLDLGDHHIGTTRMSNHPEKGVVDSECRMHCDKRIYIASSSVFPTGGYANPTLTIIALAIRIANHIKNELL